jgi:hypothetical protein
MSIDAIDPAHTPRPSSGANTVLPDLDTIPLYARNIAALRGLGFTFRQIAKGYGITPQAASLTISRQRETLKTLKRQSDFTGLSPRAVSCLGRLGIKTRASARAMADLEVSLRNQRNCGQKTIREVLDWAVQ